MLKNITIPNFLEEGKTLCWDLNPDVNILWGKNGSGKSYLLERLSWEEKELTWEGEPHRLHAISGDINDYRGIFNGFITGVPFSDKLPFSGIPEGNLSGGQHRLYYILGIATKYKDETYTLLIDDIEANLHITLQRTIIKHLRDINPNCQLLVTTHSPCVVKNIRKGFNIEDLIS